VGAYAHPHLHSSRWSVRAGLALGDAVLGANLGIAVTMMIADWGSTEGRRLAVGSLLVKGFGALLVLLGGSNLFVLIFHLLPGVIDRQAANFNGESKVLWTNSKTISARLATKI
jgi:Na+/phosphate symporter